jgi:hypothetical protein
MNIKQTINVGTEKQLFIDSRWFETSHGMTLRVNPPIKAEQVLTAEMPWETKGILPGGTILEHLGEYRLWYHTGAKDKQGFKYSLCYATSADGIHFQRQNVNLFEFDGSKENNIVIPGGAGVIMLDPIGSEEHRFKMLASMAEDDVWPEAKGTNLRSHEPHVGASPDGIRWKLLKPPALPFCHDTQNQMFYDTRIQKYVAYVRTHEYGRTVSRVEVENPLSLPFPYRDLPVTRFGAREGVRMPPRGVLDVVIFRDDADPPSTDIYTPCVHQYSWAADAYFSFPAVYRPPYYGGAPLPGSMRSHNNRTYAAAAYLGVVGVHQNRQDYKDEAKLMVKEYLMFGVHPQGYMGDFERWWNNNRIEPEQGLAYAPGCAAEVIRIADVLARTGDMELYEYTTSQGLAGTEGGAKNLLKDIPYQWE